MDHRFPPCDICDGSGMVPVYHREYTGDPTVYREVVDRLGEVKTIRVAGVINAHCSCGLGEWMRGKLEDDVLRRIPRLADVAANRTHYQFDDPTFSAESPPDHASDFLRAWRATFGKKRAGREPAEKFCRRVPTAFKETEAEATKRINERSRREIDEALVGEELS